MKRYGYTFQKVDGIYTKALDVRFLIIFAGFLFWIFSLTFSEVNILLAYILCGFFYILLAMLAEILPWIGLPCLIVLTMIVSIVFVDPTFLYSWRPTDDEISNKKLVGAFFIMYNFTITFSALLALRKVINVNKLTR